MAKLKVLSSSSAGNCYILECGGEKLMIECGIKWTDILRGLGYSVDKVVGCILSHNHQDHSKSIHKALVYQIPVYSCADVAKSHKGVRLLKPNNKYKIGNFAVQPIPVKHNVECYAYLIEHEEMGRMIFATDLSEFPYRVKNIRHWLIEANYDDDILLQRLCDNEILRSRSENHLSIDRCTDALSMNYNQNLMTVTLVHLSDENSNAEAFTAKIKDVIGIEPKIALPGLEVELEKEEF